MVQHGPIAAATDGAFDAGLSRRSLPPPPPMRRERTSETAPEAVGQAVRRVVRGGCQSGWGERLPSVTNATEAGTCRQGDSGWA